MGIGQLGRVKVLALTHGPSVRPGVFADAVRAGGHELVEQQVPVAGAPTDAADAVIVLGGAMHPDEEERHGWLRPELEYLGELLENGTPVLGVCLGSQLIARAAGASVFRAAEPEVGWLPVELTVVAATDPVASSLPERFDAFQSAPLHARAPRGRGRAGAQPHLHAGVPARSGVGRPVPPGGAGGAGGGVAEWDPDDVADPQALREATRERIDAWNDLGRGLCSAFLAAV